MRPMHDFMPDSFSEMLDTDFAIFWYLIFGDKKGHELPSKNI